MSDKQSGELDEFPGYIIYEDGKVFSKLSKKYISFYERNGFLYTRIMQDVEGERKRICISQHHLVAKTFIPNPENLNLVRHIDGNGLNNCMSNLEWSTQKIINNKLREEGNFRQFTKPVIQYSLDGEYIRRFDSIKEAAIIVNCSEANIYNVCIGRKNQYTASRFIWKYEDERETIDNKDEEWKDISDPKGYIISSMNGKICNKKTKRIITSIERKDSYIRITLRGKKYYVHRLVCFAFLGNPSSDLKNPVINHKDGNKSNNCASNLEWVEFDEDISHAHLTKLNSTCRPVIKYSKKGDLLEEYPSMADAAKSVYVSRAAISDACYKKVSANTIAGFIWRFKDEPLQQEELNSLKTSKREVVQYSLSGEKLKTFSSLMEASKEIGVHSSSITNACKGKTKSSGGFMWRYEGEDPPLKKYEPLEKKIEQLSLDGDHVRYWEDISYASKDLRISNSHITSVCRGKRNTTGGFRRYI